MVSYIIFGGVPDYKCSIMGPNPILIIKAAIVGFRVYELGFRIFVSCIAIRRHPNKQD